MADLETHHRRALARELTAAAGYPLRDRYGYAAPDRQVDVVLAAMFGPHRGETDAAQALGIALLDDPLAMGHDTPTDEEYELGIVRALTPLVIDRVRAQITAAARQPTAPPPAAP